MTPRRNANNRRMIALTGASGNVKPIGPHRAGLIRPHSTRSSDTDRETLAVTDGDRKDQVISPALLPRSSGRG